MATDELDILDDPEEDEVYVQYDIATYPSDLTLNGIQELWTKGDIEIPDFQREFVWSMKQASLLVESFLMGLPVPPVFFYIDEDNKSLVIDGQQRILSVVFFFEGYFGRESSHGRRQVFRLKGLSEKSPYHNLRFEDLKDSDQRKLRGSVLRAINIRQLAPTKESTSVYHIFERLNTGGTALRPQEIRNCVYRGPIVAKLRDLNVDKEWRKLLGRAVPDRFQRDMEIVLRLFSLFRDWQKYEKPMKEFLNESMKQNRGFDSEKAEEFTRLFPIACQSILEKLGEKPFHVRGPLNASILDAVFCAVLENGGKVPKDFDTTFRELLQNKDFDEGTKLATTDSAVVQRRIKLAHEYLL